LGLGTRRLPTLVFWAVFGLRTASVAGQEHQHGAIGPQLRWGAQAIGLVTHATPAVNGRDLTEGYLTQPNIFLHGSAGPVALMMTVNLEGLTLRRGELNAGTWGEGYFDRRHPHTYLHEAMLSFEKETAGTGWSVSAGKGFAPFGTDDPMTRPLVKFPANHHLAQLLERLVLIGAVRRGAFLLEGGLFNGDEPLNPRGLGQLDRFGDSWSVRLTVFPFDGSELQASHALVESPEQSTGDGLDQRKLDVALRYARDSGQEGHYLLVEWARTAELNLGDELFALRSILVEGSYRRGDWQFAARAERTTRLEEERTTSIFRTSWPHADARTWGETRWVLATASVSKALRLRQLTVVPLVEAGHQWGKPTSEPAFFSPQDLFGSEHLWSFSFGVRLTAGMPHARMGRYGVAQ
jgi:hypothetical protein